MKKRIIASLIFLVFSVAYVLSGTEIDINNITGQYDAKVIDVVKEDQGDINVYFCPKDNCSKALEEVIDSAKHSVKCAFFDLDLKNIIQSLEDKKKSGAEVKLVVDSDNYEIVENMNVSIIQDNRSAYMHNKFCIIDSKRVVSGSMNPTENGAYKNDNNLVIIDSENLAKNYMEEFYSFEQGQFGNDESTKRPILYIGDVKVENYFCPEDECAMRIKDVLNKAEKSIDLMTFSFTHDGIANSILIKMDEGVNVRGVFESRGAGSQYSKFKVLDYQGADVIKDKNRYVMHHKVFIIDEKIVVLGSFNPSNNADKRNDENVLIIYDEDIALKFIDEFERVWNYDGGDDDEKI